MSIVVDDRADEPSFAAPSNYLGTMVLNRYVLDGVLYRSPQTLIFDAHDDANGDRVSAHFMHLDASRNHNGALGAAFSQQAKAIGLCTEPSVLQIRDIGFIEHTTAVAVLPPLAGPRLADVLYETNLQAPVVIRLGAQLADALADLHARGVMVGAISAERIRLLDSAWTTQLVPAAWLTEAGLAALFIHQPPAAQPLTDLYNLGALLHNCALDPTTGQLAEGPMSDQLGLVLKALTAPHPLDRPESARAIADALHGLFTACHLDMPPLGESWFAGVPTPDPPPAAMPQRTNGHDVASVELPRSAAELPDQAVSPTTLTAILAAAVGLAILAAAAVWLSAI